MKKFRDDKLQHLRETHLSGEELCQHPVDGAPESQMLRDRGDEMAQAKKCKHAACNCMTSDGKDYCGDRCKDSKNMTELTCQCNHPECKGEALKA
jgi:hypothetical protein